MSLAFLGSCYLARKIPNRLLLILQPKAYSSDKSKETDEKSFHAVMIHDVGVCVVPNLPNRFL